MFGFEKLSTTTQLFIVLVVVSFIICSMDNKEGFSNKKRMLRRRRRWLKRLWARRLALMREARGYDTRCYKSRICYRGRGPGNYGTVNSCKTSTCKGLNNKVCRPTSKGSKGKYWCCKNGKWVKNINDACTMVPVKYCRNVIRCY